MRSDDKIFHKELSYELVGILYEVYNELGYGHKEKFYELGIEKLLIRNNLRYKNQIPYKI